ncbi:MAG: sulfite exporter TauE/SafE family protein [Chloroflexi bacterium]|nr:sulfite exporter TauE/SafE family protein [Chloroflexota bacterium]
MEVLLLNLGLGFGIGASLGMLGGGGSILTVPALVYLVGQSPQAAITTSLAIVGANSLLGAFFHRMQGTLNWRVALIFGSAGMIVSYLSAGLSKLFSPPMLLVAFAVLMLAVGALLIARRQPERDARQPAELAVGKVVLSGAAVGLLTGILGVGGGFLIVPALVMLVGLPFHQAVGTSLVVIAMNSLAGFLGHVSGVPLDITLIAIFVLAGLAGTFAGAQMAKHLNPGHLRRVFAVFVIALAIFLLYDNLPKLV